MPPLSGCQAARRGTLDAADGPAQTRSQLPVADHASAHAAHGAPRTPSCYAGTVTRSRCRHGDGLPSTRRPRAGTPAWPARCSCAADRRRRPMWLKAGGIGHVAHHVIRLQFERERRAVGEAPPEGSEEFVELMLPMRVAHPGRSQARYGTRAPRVGRHRRCARRDRKSVV